jgi:predicted nucleic acid-binding protein
MPALADTTVLSNFAQVLRADLLRAAYPDLAAPTAVWTELEAGARRGLVPVCDWSWLAILELSEREQAAADEIGRSLGRGESACLALARSRKFLLLSDDWDARKLGRSLGLEISGSLGVLDRLVSQQTLGLEAADALLEEMVRRGFRSPYRSLGEIPR